MDEYQELTEGDLPYHLSADAKGARCPSCGRTTWTRDELGKPCSMPQPNGSACDGVMPDKFEDD